MKKTEITQDNKVLQPKAGVRVLCLFIYLLGILIIAVGVSERFKMMAVVGYAVVGALWVTDVFITRIVLGAEKIFIFSYFRLRTILRSDIEGVTWKSGCDAFLKLRDGKRVSLPNAGQNAQGIANTVRAWLNKTQAVE
jgi:hypothetical protein